MVKKNDYPRKNNFSKDGTQTNESAGAANSQQKPSQKDGETFHKESHTRNNRSSRDNQQRDAQKRENANRENQSRENSSKENGARENVQRDNQHKDNFQRNYHRENNNQNRENRENRDSYRQHFQRPAIKPRAEETVNDIAADIGRIEKEIELELKEIRSMRLGV